MSFDLRFECRSHDVALTVAERACVASRRAKMLPGRFLPQRHRKVSRLDDISRIKIKGVWFGFLKPADCGRFLLSKSAMKVVRMKQAQLHSARATSARRSSRALAAFESKGKDSPSAMAPNNRGR